MFSGRGGVMKWITERDLLIAQTKAFVQSVTGRRPEFAAQPISAEPARSEHPTIAAHPAPAEPSASFEPVAQADRSPPGISTVLVLPHSDVRQEIQSRIAAFQVHQHRFHRDREAYFKSVLTRARSEIGNGPDAPSA
jgi:hypothetical protein